ncbi:solute carrier family 35 member E1 homolog [Planococcus citri]|uniref:solute carrier family 35 member E1 homolog n=1 Tax=Planococcus citri TaxID=170843 RepID=UPI0031F80A8A
MVDPKFRKEIITILTLCILWYSSSSSNSVIGKLLLNEFPFPMTVTMVQLLSITVYSGPFFNVWGVRKFADISWPYYMKIIVPLALGKFFVSVLTHVSIWKVPVSYAHTVKATMPLFSVVLSRVILGEKQTCRVYASLLPIVTGVLIATLTELSFDVMGLISALVATLQMSLQNIFSKKVLQDVGIHHLRLLHILGRLAFFMFIPFWLYFDLQKILSETVIMTDRRYYIMALLFADGLLNWLQNIFAFTIMSMVTSLTFAVANATKRVFIIFLSLFILGNPVTPVNVFGMMLAVVGVLAYNKAKYDARMSDSKKTLLPFIKSRREDQLPFDYKYHKLNHNNGYLMNGYSKLSKGADNV